MIDPPQASSSVPLCNAGSSICSGQDVVMPVVGLASGGRVHNLFVVLRGRV
jgi:hypothetical protein